MDTLAQTAIEWSVSLDPDSVLQAFISYLNERDRSSFTVSAFVSDVRAFAVWCGVEYHIPFSIDNFNRHDLRAYQRYSCDGKHSAPATWNRRISGLRLFSNWLRQVDLITYDPTNVLARMAEERNAPRWFTAGEYRAFTIALEKHVNIRHKGIGELRKATHLRDYAAVSLMLYAGLRVAELCALDVGDVSLGERSGMVVVRLGKGRKLRRVPLSHQARAGISPWMDALHGQDDDPLMVNEDGKRLSTRAIQRLVAELGRVARIDHPVSPHDLRHTFAKRMAKDGERLEVIKELLGHSNLNTTLIYVQPGWEDLQNAVEKI